MENQTIAKGISVIGVIPQYPKHSQNNIYAFIKMPPIGIISILSQMNGDPRFKTVYAIDENNYAGPRDFMDLPDHGFLQNREPASIAMFYGGMSNSIPRMFSVAQGYKRVGAVTLAGGSHVDALPEEALRSGLDIIVHGEGEATILEILDIIVKDGKVALDRGALAGVKGISFLDEDGKVVFTGKREPIQHLDALKSPDLTLVHFLEKRWSAIPINKGRGCNWKCEFCVVNKLYGPYKSFSIDKTMEQIIKYSDMGYRGFFFTDDNFAQNIPETIELCKRIGDYKRKFRKKIDFTVQVRNEIAENDALLDAMKYAGVTILAIGFESPINEELKSMNKGVTVEKLVARSRKLASRDFWLHGMFIFGYPTFKDSPYKSPLSLARRARRFEWFFKKAKLDTMQVLNAVPLPGSELRAKLEAEQRLLPFDWKYYDGQYVCYDPQPEGLDPFELQALPRALMSKRYLGNFFERTVNYGNWMDWAYNFTVGFPTHFGLFYIRRFIRNLVEKRRERNVTAVRLMPRRNIFYASLANAWEDMKRKLRNLLVRTYAGGIVKRWKRAYKKLEHARDLKTLRKT